MLILYRTTHTLKDGNFMQVMNILWEKILLILATSKFKYTWFKDLRNKLS